MIAHRSQGAELDGPGPLPTLKGEFPFRLSTTSYIIPAPILPNVEFLGPHLDEVELVLFESGQEQNLPSRSEIRELFRLARRLGLTYNVHLPTDVFLGDPRKEIRRASVDTLLRFYRRTVPLEPTLYVLHLETRSTSGEKETDPDAWLVRVRSSLEELWRAGVDPGMVALENLGYPPTWLRPLVEEMGVWYCVDVGHLIRYGFEAIEELRQSLPRCAMLHLHGVEDGVDHRGVHLLPGPIWEGISRMLQDYQAGVSIEVFSLEDLRESMAMMARLVEQRHQSRVKGRGS